MASVSCTFVVCNCFCVAFSCIAGPCEALELPIVCKRIYGLSYLVFCMLCIVQTLICFDSCCVCRVTFFLTRRICYYVCYHCCLCCLMAAVSCTFVVCNCCRVTGISITCPCEVYKLPDVCKCRNNNCFCSCLFLPVKTCSSCYCCCVDRLSCFFTSCGCCC